MLSDPIFQKLWERISRKTTYELRFETDDVVAEAVKRINAMEPLEPIKFRVAKTAVDMNAEGVVAGDSRDRGTVEVEGAASCRTSWASSPAASPLSRATIVRILKDDRQPRPGQGQPVGLHRPGRRRDQPGALRPGRRRHRLHARRRTIAGRPSCSRARTRTRRSPSRSSSFRCRRASPTRSSATRASRCGSPSILEERDDVPLFIKLPGWFKSPRRSATTTPTGRSSARRTAGDYLYLVRETKGTDSIESAPVGVRGLEDQVRQGALQRAEGRLRLPLGPGSRRRDRCCARGFGKRFLVSRTRCRAAADQIPVFTGDVPAQRSRVGEPSSIRGHPAGRTSGHCHRLQSRALPDPQPRVPSLRLVRESLQVCPRANPARVRASQQPLAGSRGAIRAASRLYGICKALRPGSSTTATGGLWYRSAPSWQAVPISLASRTSVPTVLSPTSKEDCDAGAFLDAAQMNARPPRSGRSSACGEPTAVNTPPFGRGSRVSRQAH